MYFICEKRNLLRIAEYCRVAGYSCTSVWTNAGRRCEFAIYGSYIHTFLNLIEKSLFTHAFRLPGKQASCRICGAVLLRIELFPVHCLHHYLRKMVHEDRCPIGWTMKALETRLRWREKLRQNA